MGLLRFLLALSVVLEHSSTILGFGFVGGLLAVKAFYIISGFYMTLILNNKYVGKNNSYILFIKNRFLRLFPIYWIILILTVLYSIAVIIFSKGEHLGLFTIYANYMPCMNFGSLAFIIFSNIFLVFQDTIMFLGLNTQTGYLFFTSNFHLTDPKLYHFLFIPQAWTIGVEITFYLIAPFIVRRKLIYILPLIFLSLLLRFILSHAGLNADPWSYRFFPSELVFFLLGIVSYHIFQKIKIKKINPVYLYVIFIYMVGFTLIYSFLPFENKNVLYLTSFFICLPFIFKLSSKWKTDYYIGDLTYPIYISHLFVLTCITKAKTLIFGELGLSLAFFTIIFSVLLNELIAKRIEKIRQKRFVTTVN